MDFSHSNIDARQCSFNQVGGDWNQHTTIHKHTFISISCFGPRQINYHSIDNLSDVLPLVPVSSPKTLSPRCHITSAYRSSDILRVIDASIGLIAQITNRLMDHSDSSNNHQVLQLQLRSLQQILTLTGLAIHEYCDRPLGQGLAKTVTPEVERCLLVLQELLEQADATWLGLAFTGIGDFWRRVWWGRWGGNEFAVLRKKLSNSRQSLERFLMALHSVAWMELGNELFTGSVSFRRFHNLFGQYLPFLGHIKLNAVHLVNHLGDIIPVPTIFCATWKDFDYIVQGHCRDSIGNYFIERGDYEVIRPEDNRIIGPSELASTVEPGMTLEMCIVLRQKRADWKRCPRCNHVGSRVFSYSNWSECDNCAGQFQISEAQEQCPRCRHINSNATVDCGWIQWKFQVAESNLKHQGKEYYSSASDEERGEMLGEMRNKESDGENDDEGIISPASGTRGIVNGNTFASEQPRQLHDDGVQFLRRIHVICMSDEVIPLGSIELDRNPDGIAHPPDLDQLSGRIAKLSTVHGEVPTTTTPDDFLDHLPYGAKSAVEVDDLIQAAREFYRQIEILQDEESTSGHPAALAVVKEIKTAAMEYSEAIAMSVKMAAHGVTFAADAVGLYEYLGRHSGADVRLFMDEMRQIARLAHVDAKESYEKFSTVRRTFLQIIRQTLRQKEQATLELLDKVANNLRVVVISVHKYALWWSDAETMTYNLGNRNMSGDGQGLSTIQINMTRNSWGAVQRQYMEYKTTIGTLHDFYPTHKMQTSDPWFRRIFRRKATGVH